jgi:hypothetical protein
MLKKYLKYYNNVSKIVILITNYLIPRWAGSLWLLCAKNSFDYLFRKNILKV